MPDLALLEAVASDSAPRTVTLSGISVTVLLSCLDAANRWFDWFEDGKQVTYSRYADVLDYLAAARFELMANQIGDVRITAAADIPDGCLVCDGATYEKADYPLLYATLAPLFILNSTQFKVPDLRDGFIRGSSASFPSGSTGGEESHTLTVDEIPGHSHTIPATFTTLAVEPGEVTVLTPVPIITQNTGDTGGSGSHNNVPPFVALQYYIVAQ